MRIDCFNFCVHRLRPLRAAHLDDGLRALAAPGPHGPVAREAVARVVAPDRRADVRALQLRLALRTKGMNRKKPQSKFLD